MILCHISLYGIWQEQEVYGLAPLQDTVDVALLFLCSSFLFYHYFTSQSPCVLFVLKTIHAFNASPFIKILKSEVVLFTLYIYRGYLHITDLFSFDYLHIYTLRIFV